MLTFFASFAVVWMAVLAYTALLGVRQRRLNRRIEVLQESRNAL